MANSLRWATSIYHANYTWPPPTFFVRAFHWNGNFTFILFFPQTFQNVDIQPLTDLSNSPLCTTLCITLYHLIYGNKNIKTYFNKPLLIECIPLLLYSNELLDHLLDLLKYFDSFLFFSIALCVWATQRIPFYDLRYRKQFPPFLSSQPQGRY